MEKPSQELTDLAEATIKLSKAEIVLNDWLGIAAKWIDKVCFGTKHEEMTD